MLEGSQVQDEMWEDAANLADHETESRDFVKCLICGHSAKKLHVHLKKMHSINKKQYQELYPGASVLSENSRLAYSKANKLNGPKANEKMKADGKWDDVQERRSQTMKNLIANDPHQQEIRRQNMVKINVVHKEHLRKISSETAKKTSARPEILAARSENLRRWRDEHSEDFYEKCTKKMMSTFQSKPEKLLFKIVSEKFPFLEFKRNQRLYSELLTNSSKRKQIDIFSQKFKIIIEYDGPCHFHNHRGDKALEIVQVRDLEMEKIFCEEFMIIRVSDSCHKYATKSFFLEHVLVTLFNLLLNPFAGIYKLGEEYGEDNLLQTNR
jgi:very-short-patch-repair endonuclease